MMTDLLPVHFYDESIEVLFDRQPALEKTPPCPNAFIWNERTYRVIESLAEWRDYSRKGRMARNLQPAHAQVASTRGSLNVGRFYFRLKVDSNQIFDTYYDRAAQSVEKRKGVWFIYRELE